VVLIVFNKAVVLQLEGHAQLDRDLLLFQKDKLVILHVVLSVRFQIRSQLMQVEAVFIGASLPIQEELTKFTGTETGSNHSVI